MLGECQWFTANTRKALDLLGEFAQVESIELHAGDREEEWEWTPDQPLNVLLTELSHNPTVDAVVIWLTLHVRVGEQDIQQSAANSRIATYENPFSVEISLNLESNAYAGRLERLSLRAILVNRARLEALLRRLEGGLDVVFNYCESRAFPDRIYRYGYLSVREEGAEEPA